MYDVQLSAGDFAVVSPWASKRAPKLQNVSVRYLQKRAGLLPRRERRRPEVARAPFFRSWGGGTAVPFRPLRANASDD